MPWWTFGLGGSPPKVSRETTEMLKGKAFTAAATIVPDSSRSFLPSSGSWQNEVWAYYDSLGEYQYAVDWKSRMLSRVRLYAARIEPGQDEPVRLDDDSLAVQLVSSLGGASSQASLMEELSSQLDIPGEGFLIAENDAGFERWSVRSTDEIRKRNNRFEIVDENTLDQSQVWREIAPDHLIIRVFKPHKRYHHIANSSSRAARGTMRELELVNRHILSQYLSRLASAGLVIFPEEISFPVREEFADAPDPFMAEWIEIAATAIKEPGTASAVIPIPVRVPAEMAEAIRHIDFTLQLDDQIIEKRESAIRRLATQLNIPAEILTGMGAINHWGAWQLEEGALKTTIAPDAETICSALTSRYLQPRLAASGEDTPGRYVVWYDMSELTLRPDRSTNATRAYDRMELSGEAYRRENGFDESDKPDNTELVEMALKSLLRSSSNLTTSVLQELTGLTLEETASSSPGSAAPEPPATPVETDQTLPDVEETPPTSEPPAIERVATARTVRLIAQSNAPHGIRFNGQGSWEILHPHLCDNHAYSCPYVQAALKTRANPGRSGIYECSLSPFGELRIGEMNPQFNVGHFFPTKNSNGVKHGYSS